jgi:Fe-S-cluster containining protein
MAGPEQLPNLSLLQQRVKLEGYYAHLEALHQGYDAAQRILERNIGRPICVERCGACCTHATPLAYGFEAEYAFTHLLRHPHLGEILTRLRDWLTQPGKWVPVSAMRGTKEIDLQDNLAEALNGRCPFLDDDMRCAVHAGRPLVCRSYGLTHMPNRWCPRGVGLGEDGDTRSFIDPDDKRLPLRPFFNEIKAQVKERRFARWAFLPTMIYERFRPDDLASLVDDGKVPLVKLYQNWGRSPMMLWQEDVDRMWRAEGADLSISEKPPLVSNGNGGFRLRYYAEKLLKQQR